MTIYNKYFIYCPLVLIPVSLFFGLWMPLWVIHCLYSVVILYLAWTVNNCGHTYNVVVDPNDDSYGVIMVYLFLLAIVQWGLLPVEQFVMRVI